MANGALAVLALVGSLCACVLHSAAAAQCNGKEFFSETSSDLPQTLAMNDTATASATTVNVVSHKRAMMGNFVAVIASYCDVTIPADAAVRIQSKMFVARRQHTGDAQCVQVEDGAIMERLCSADDPLIYLQCKDVERTIVVRYVTSDTSVSVVFEIQFQASSGALLSVSCGKSSNSQLSPSDDSIPSHVETQTAAPSWVEANLLGIGRVGFFVIIAASAVGVFMLIAAVARHIYRNAQVKKRSSSVQMLAQDLDKMAEGRPDECIGSSDGIKLISAEYDCALDEYHKDLFDDATDT